jgi:hypothetical protein
MALVIILFFIYYGPVFSQCRKHTITNQSVSLEGITSGIDYYYQNLIIQDIALAGQQSFHEIALRFDYRLHYITDQCRPDRLEIRVLPLSMKGFSLFYRGYNVASAVRPEKADLIFHILDHHGFVTDSVIFYDIPLERDSSLYTSLTSSRSAADTNMTVKFTRAVFHYTKSSYEAFRDRILIIDQYYAASLIADSARVWAEKGFLAETGVKAEMILRQVELERIIDYIRPDQFDSVLMTGQPDIAGLNEKFRELARLNIRFKSIISFDRFESSSLVSSALKKELISEYLDMLDHFHEMAYKTDFSFVNFIEGIANPDFNNAGLLVIHQLLNNQKGIDTSGLRPWCKGFIQSLVSRGDTYRSSNNQLRALTYYEAAFHLSQLMNLHENEVVAFRLVGMMKDSIATSYTEISRKSALKDSPVMAAKYYENACDQFTDKDFKDFEPAMLRDFETWLYSYFENRAVTLIDAGQFGKALVYLNVIQSHCLDTPTYPCPGAFHEWMRTVRNGIYHNLLDKAGNLMADEELPEAEDAYRQAVETRMRAGYRIEKDNKEYDLQQSFRQLHYDELRDEGIEYLDRDEFSSALYYFNKAFFLERAVVKQPDPGLPANRQTAARGVINDILSDGRVKAWAFDFDGAGVALEKTKSMLSEYGFPEDDTLADQYSALQDYIYQNECVLVFREYNEKIAGIKIARENNDFILALKLANDAINLSLDHINCRIRDDEAWYQKVVLEPPAQFQEKEKELEALARGPCSGYLSAFGDLKNYYYHDKLLEQGVVFISLNDRIIKATDTLFLSCMMDHYLYVNDLENAYKMMERLRLLGCPRGPLFYQQRSLAEALARRDAKNPTTSAPWQILSSYTGNNSWYLEFTWEYKYEWMKAVRWKFSYWPFIWKK